MTTVHFVKSALTVVPSPELCIVEWGHGPAHVIGGVELAFQTTQPGSWWRSTGQALAPSLVQAVGGVVWDDQGLIRITAPELWATQAHEKISGLARSQGAYDPTANEALLVTSGAARWTPVCDEKGEMKLRLSPVHAPPMLSHHGGVRMILIQPEDYDQPKVVVTATCGDQTTFTFKVPMIWATSPFGIHSTAAVVNEIDPSLNRPYTGYSDDEEA